MLMRKCLLAILILMLVILMLILMLLNLNTGYADTDADLYIRIMSLCCMYDYDECPECNALMVENFQCLDIKRYIFQCCKRKSYFIPDEEPENPPKRRKTE